MEKIIVATDFSTRSDRAIRRATLIAQRLQSSLTLVHVVDHEQTRSMIEAEAAAAQAALAETARTIHDVDGIPVDADVQIDDVVGGILNAADDAGARLIVIGPHRKRFTDIFVGTTAERIVRRSWIPLLVAVHAPSAPYVRTLLALDFDDASKAAATAAIEMGIFKNTSVVAFHAFHPLARGMMKRSLVEQGMVDDYVESEGRRATGKLKALVARLDLPSSRQQVVEIQGSTARTILDAAVAENADLIVVGASNRKGFERLLIGSVTEDVLHEAHRDILIVPVDDSLGPE